MKKFLKKFLNLPKKKLRTIYLIWIIFILLLFIISIYLYIQNTNKIEMISTGTKEEIFNTLEDSILLNTEVTDAIIYISCKDSDNGADETKQGTVDVEFSYNTVNTTEHFIDTCTNDNELIEYSCSKENNIILSKITCNYGCDKGICLVKPSDKESKASTCTDKDKDGYGNPADSSCQYNKLDCNDNNKDIYPGAKEICGNNIDEDCNGSDLACTSTRSICGNNICEGDETPGSCSADCEEAIVPTSYRAFSNDSYWNTPMPINAPIDENNSIYIVGLKDTSESSPPYLRLSGAPDHVGGEDWAYPIYWASTTDPLYSVSPYSYGPDVSVKIPYNASPQAGSDGALIIYNIAEDKVIEFYESLYNPVSNLWNATSTKRYILSSNGLSKRVVGSNDIRNDGHRGIPSPIRAIRLDEVQSGVIRRRLECFLYATGRPNDNTPYYYWPMDGYESGKGGITPEGLIMRIKPSVDLNSKGLTTGAKIIAKAMQDYGCIIGDNEGGTKTSLKLERGQSGWSSIDPNLSLEGLSSLTWDDYEFIQGGYAP